MIELTADEARVLGVLVEKAQTTPEQYPLSLNALVNGANQKNNRDPVTELDENAVFSAVESLRAKGLVVRVDQMGARVSKYRHNANEVLHVRTAELVILAELMLRGPQTLGELRARASRMHPLESTEQAQGMLDALMNRPEPLAKMIPPSPGTRAQRFVQLLCADSHPIEATTVTAESPTGDFKERINRLEEQVRVLRQAVVQLAGSLGESVLLENLDQKPADS
ncbi:MAG: YceH family protein [Phycisphaerales bacterium]|nr:YceH family protein [Phycisphaerales bacterium]